MKCPSCGSNDSKVIDSRPFDENNSIRRRRECNACHFRFTTYEVVDCGMPVVVKKDGTKELFDKNKLLSGLMRACHKRPVNAAHLADAIEADIAACLGTEITTNRIGEIVMDRLRTTDEVAYVRYASVYREFKDIEGFEKEITELRQKSDKNAADAVCDGIAAESETKVE